MIIDTTGVELIPGNRGLDCPGNGFIPTIECCCDECDYMLCCLESHKPQECKDCKDLYCPHAPRNSDSTKL